MYVLFTKSGGFYRGQDCAKSNNFIRARAARVKEDNLNGWSGGRKYGPSQGPVAGSSGFWISFIG